MRSGTDKSEGHQPRQGTLARRLGWFAALWLGSVVALGVVAMLIKLALRAG